MNYNFPDLMQHNSFVLMGHATPCYNAGNLGETELHLDCFGVGSKTINSSNTKNLNTGFSAQDDGCGLVLGLGPTPNLYSATYQSSNVHRAKETAPSLFGKSFSFTDSGVLRLGLQRETSEAAPKLLSFAVDEGSTSAKRNSGGYMPSLLFAPRSDPFATNQTELRPKDLLDMGSNTTENNHTTHQELQSSPETSVTITTTECSFGVSSDMVTGSEQHNHQSRHPKKCQFKGCSKGARGASRLCIAHGGGQRCQKAGCNKGAESSTAYCKAHGGGRRCQHLGCTKSAEGKTDFCIAHGGGRRCGQPGCTKAARGKSGRCIKHGGGKRCTVEGCTRSAEGKAGLCISHGGGRRCQYPDCDKGAQASTMYCKAHGGGKRCVFEGCTKGAEGSTPLCKGHGGGKRCLFDGGGVCPKSVHGGTSFCVAHGGGKRCAVPGCTKSARGRTDCCVMHGGGKRCKFDGCAKSAQGSTDFCKAHGGGKRCSWSTGCEKFARGKNGLCAAHGSLMAKERGGGMIRPGLFQGVVSSTTNGYSSSGISTLSDCDAASLGSVVRTGQGLIPPQVLVPFSMKSAAHSSAGLVVPEGRVHGGGLMNFLGGNFKNAADDKKV